MVTRAPDPGPWAVHLWFLDPAARFEPRWIEVLDAEERERARALRTVPQQEAFVAAHALVRTALSAREPRPPEAWRLLHSALGQPAVAGSSTGLRFSLTHAGPRAAVAVGTGAAIGLDLEAVRSGRDPLPLARRFFSAPEAEWLGSLPGAERPSAFAMLWTAKEAVLKARGSGLTELGSVHVEPGLSGGRLRVDAPGGPWTVLAWSTGDGLAAALAVETDAPLALSTYRAVPLGAPTAAPEFGPRG